MKFQRQPVYHSSGKRINEQRERVVDSEELARLLPSQTRKVLEKLLKKDPDLSVKLSSNGDGRNFKVELSANFYGRYRDSSYLAKKLRAVEVESYKKCDDETERQMEVLRSEIKANGKVERAVLQQRQLIEDVLNKKREPTKNCKTKKNCGVLENKLSPKLRKREVDEDGNPQKRKRWVKPSPKGSPYCFSKRRERAQGSKKPWEF